MATQELLVPTTVLGTSFQVFLNLAKRIKIKKVFLDFFGQGLLSILCCVTLYKQGCEYLLKILIEFQFL